MCYGIALRVSSHPSTCHVQSAYSHKQTAVIGFKTKAVPLSHAAGIIRYKVVVRENSHCTVNNRPAFTSGVAVKVLK